MVKENKSHFKKKFSVFNLGIGALLALYAALLILFLYLIVISSIKTQDDIYENFFGFPSAGGWMFKNIFDALSAFACRSPLADGNVGLLPSIIDGVGFYPGIIINTILYAFGGALCSTIVPCFVSYVVAKFDYKFSKILYGVVIVTMILPIVGNYPSMISVMQTLHIYDNFIGGWLQKCNFLGMYFLIFYAAFKSLPNDYMEAAYIDGASEWKVLLKVMFPLVRPIFLTIMIIHFIDIWNDYQTVLLYLPSFPTISLAVYMQVIVGDTAKLQQPQYKMAACMIMVIPTVTLFVVFRDKLMGNLSMGGIKG